MGIKVSDNYEASGYLSADDVGREEIELQIVACDLEDPDDKGEKICIRFADFEQVLLLNRTNAEYLAEKLGDDTDNWLGQKIVLYTAQTMFGGRKTRGIRVRVPVPATAPAEAKTE